jgi:2-isopropylmalate synthase
MALRTRQDYYQAATRIQTTRLVPTSRLVAGITGISVQRNKAIVGRNAFAHEAGIHQDGMLKEPRTYEIMRPEDVGFARTDLVLGKHSGRAALSDRAQALGFHLTEEQMQEVFERFKELADKKKEVYDGDIASLIRQQIHHEDQGEQWVLDSFEVHSGTRQKPRVTLTLSDGGVTKSITCFEGDGPIDCAFVAVERLTGLRLNCREFRLRSETVGHDAQGEALLEVEHEDRIYRGRAASTDTVEASILAIVDAVNRIAQEKKLAATGRSALVSNR